jgi:hypothetical protein
MDKPTLQKRQMASKRNKRVFRNKQAGIATNMCSRIILEKQGITSL